MLQWTGSEDNVLKYAYIGGDSNATPTLCVPIPKLSELTTINGFSERFAREQWFVKNAH